MTVERSGVAAGRKITVLAAWALSSLGAASARAADPWAEVESFSAHRDAGVLRAHVDAAELARQGRWEEAVEEGEVASLRSDDPEARLVLAEALLAVGRPSDALARAREAVVLARAMARAERGPAVILALVLYAASSAAYRSREPAMAWAFLDEAAQLDPHGERLRAWAAGGTEVILAPGEGLFLEALCATRAAAWQDAAAALAAWRRACPGSPYEEAAVALGQVIASRTRESRPRLTSPPGARAVLSGLLTLRTVGITAPRLDAAMRPLRPALKTCADDVAAQEVEALRARGAHLELELVFDRAGRLQSGVPLVVSAEAGAPSNEPRESPGQVWQDLAACWTQALSRDLILDRASSSSATPRRARLRAAWR